MNKNEFQPIILIGAARSGTKFVRDTIALHPMVDKVPYDINYIWRLGNERLTSDEISTEDYSEKIGSRIRQKFNSYSSGSPYLIEKTVSNCLRVPFVKRVFPDAKFIYLYRDGWDVIESVYRQWAAPPDLSYIIKKAARFPIIDAFGYAVSYSSDTLRKLFLRDNGKASTWGPRYQGIDRDVTTMDLIEVCAIQWARSVEKAFNSLNQIPEDRVLMVRYEDFVYEPLQYLHIIAEFCGFNPRSYIESFDESLVSRKNVGKGIQNLTSQQKALIDPHIQVALNLIANIKPDKVPTMKDRTANLSAISN